MITALAPITTLKSGSHKPPNGEFAACVMEAVSYIANEPWSDHPACTCPVIHCVHGQLERQPSE